MGKLAIKRRDEDGYSTSLSSVPSRFALVDYKPRTFPTRVKKKRKPETPTPAQQAARDRGAYLRRRTTIELDGEEMEVNVGQSPHRPNAITRNQVQMMAAYGIQQEVMAKLMGIGTLTLAKYYRPELDIGQDRANSVVASRLFKTAAFGKGKEAVTAAIFWLKTRGRGKFNETQRHELTGRDGSPITTAGIQLTDEERAIRLFQALASRAEESD